MNILAEDWPKAPLKGVLVASVIFLTILPSLGLVWHRVLPEHTHIFLEVARSEADEVVPGTPSPDGVGLCLDCTTPALVSGVVHLPGTNGFEVLGLVAALELTVLGFVLPVIPERVVALPFLYRSPSVPPLDRPPIAGA